MKNYEKFLSISLSFFMFALALGGVVLVWIAIYGLLTGKI